jgi:hypothetical protein
MKHILRVVFVVCLAVLSSGFAIAQQSVAPPPRPANDAPANAEVLMLLRAGMPESVVLDKIHATTDQFDTSASALVTLKQAGASEAELKAIMAQGAAHAEQPPAAPTDTGPSLAETMQFIQDKLNEQGKVVFVALSHDTNDGSTWPTTFTSEISNVVANQNQCRISYHRKLTSVASDSNKNEDDVFSLLDVQEIVVKPFEQVQTEWLAQNGQPETVVTSTTAHMTALVVTSTRGEENSILFAGSALADRVAKAMLHAVELCGGGNKEKF